MAGLWWLNHDATPAEVVRRHYLARAAGDLAALRATMAHDDIYVKTLDVRGCAPLHRPWRPHREV